jgi:hypothetical protein
MEHVEHLWTVLCRDIRQGADGLVSLDGLMDMVAVSALPSDAVVASFACCVVSNWRRNEDPGTEFLQRLMLQLGGDESGRVHVAGPDPVVLSNRHLFSVANRITELPLRGYGQYAFVVQRQDADGAWRDAPPTAGLWVPSPEQLRQRAVPTQPSPSLLRKMSSRAVKVSSTVLAEPQANFAPLPTKKDAP